jgi:hypothetical protein
LDEAAGIGEVISEEIRKGEIVTVGIGGGFGVLGAFEVGDGFGELAGAGVKLTEIMIGVVGVRFERDSFFELLLGEVGLAELEKIVAEVGAGGGGIGLETDGGLEMVVSLVVLRLRGVDEPEEFVDFETLGDLRKEFFEQDGSLGIMAGVVLGDGGLEFSIEILLLGAGQTGLRSAGEENQKCSRHKESPESHDEIMVAPGHNEVLRAKKAGKELLAKRLPGGV